MVMLDFEARKSFFVVLSLRWKWGHQREGEGGRDSKGGHKKLNFLGDMSLFLEIAILLYF